MKLEPPQPHLVLRRAPVVFEHGAALETPLALVRVMEAACGTGFHGKGSGRRKSGAGGGADGMDEMDGMDETDETDGVDGMDGVDGLIVSTSGQWRRASLRQKGSTP